MTEIGKDIDCKIGKQTFLGRKHDELMCCESIIAGIVHEQVSLEENVRSGFYFEESEIIPRSHPFGNVYVFREWGYVSTGYSWYRFKLEDFQLISN